MPRVLVPLILAVLLDSCSGASMKFERNGDVPTQIHIAYGNSPSEMVVTWSTVQPVRNPAVRFGRLSTHKVKSVPATTVPFVDGGIAQRTQYMHSARLGSLQPDQRYVYRVGSDAGPWSQSFNFSTMPAGQAWAPRLAVFGDLGLANPQSLPRLARDIKANMYDALIHIGDFGYDMADNDSRVGDAYLEMMQPLAAHLPYMTCPGNHEYHYNFSNYKARFVMPDDGGKKMFYSFNMGPIHFISISTEYYYYVNYGIAQMKHQYDWLVKDLQKATRPENRAKRPWIILFGHRPMYCSNGYFDCNILTRLLRNGYFGAFGIEPLLSRYGVDLTIWAHEHSYERLWPIYQGKVFNGTIPGQPYNNPRAPVHIITGSAGCKERLTPFKYVKPFSAFRAPDYGYSRLRVINSTHLHWEQVSDDKAGTIIDKMLLIRDQHTPF